MSQLFHLEFRTPDGERYILHAPPHKSVWNIEGFGLPPADIATTRTPFQHGTTALSYRLNERNFTLILRHNGCSYDQKWSNRSSFINAFRLNRSSANNLLPGTLYFTRYLNEGKVTRCLDCMLQLSNSQFSNLPGWQEYSFQETLPFIAHNPIWYDPTLVIEYQDSLSEELELPMEFPFVLGCTKVTFSIPYEGTWETGPQIYLYGSFNEISLIHEDSGARINMNYAASEGENITVDLSDVNDITVTNNFCDNLISYIVDSDLVNFKILPDPLAPDGVNTISVYLAGYVTPPLLAYYTRYIGL